MPQSSSPNILDDVREIKRCVASANLEVALRLLLDFITNFNPELEDEAISVSAKYYRISSAVKKGTVGFDDGERHLTTIGYSILEMLRTTTQNLPQA